MLKTTGNSMHPVNKNVSLDLKTSADLCNYDNVLIDIVINFFIAASLFLAFIGILLSCHSYFNLNFNWKTLFSVYFNRHIVRLFELSVMKNVCILQFLHNQSIMLVPKLQNKTALY